MSLLAATQSAYPNHLFSGANLAANGQFGLLGQLPQVPGGLDPLQSFQQQALLQHSLPGVIGSSVHGGGFGNFGFSQGGPQGGAQSALGVLSPFQAGNPLSQLQGINAIVGVQSPGVQGGAVDALNRLAQQDIVNRVGQQDIINRLVQQDIVNRLAQQDIVNRLVQQDALHRLAQQEQLGRLAQQAQYARDYNQQGQIGSQSSWGQHSQNGYGDLINRLAQQQQQQEIVNRIQQVQLAQQLAQQQPWGQQQQQFGQPWGQQQFGQYPLQQSLGQQHQQGGYGDLINRLAQQQREQEIINRIQLAQLAQQQLGQQQLGQQQLGQFGQQQLGQPWGAQQGSLGQAPLGQHPGLQPQASQGALADLLGRTQQGVGGFQSWGQVGGLGNLGRAPYGIS